MKRFAIVGAGWSAQRLFRVARRHGGCEIAAVVVRRGAPAERPEFAGVPVDDDLGAVLRDRSIDAVMICTPPDSHVALARKALAAGKHVIVEKPVGLHPGEIAALDSYATACGRVVGVPFHLRFNPLLLALKARIREGVLGTILHLYHRMYLTRGRTGSWLRSPAQSGGVVFETLVHGIDLVTWLCGEPSAISGAAVFGPSGTAEAATVILTLPGGALAVLEGSWHCDDHVRFGALDVVGSRGSAVFDRGTPDRRSYDLRVRVGGTHPVAYDAHDDDDDVGFRAFLTRFIAACDTGAMPDAGSLRSAYRASCIARAAMDEILVRRAALPSRESVA
jgi:predicted dehydrogenase